VAPGRQKKTEFCFHFIFIGLFRFLKFLRCHGDAGGLAPKGKLLVVDAVGGFASPAPAKAGNGMRV